MKCAVPVIIIKVDAIAQNIRYFADSPCGELEITINLSKPEKDPREIAKLKNAPSVGYPKCMLCVENPGYAGRSNFPARQNHRIGAAHAGRRSVVHSVFAVFILSGALHCF